jgi:hypothetical protein
MRNSFLLAALCLVAAGCSPYPSSFRIEKFYPIDDVCDAEASREGATSPNGYLDVAPGSPQFFIGIQIGGAEKITQPATTVGGRVLELPDRDRPILQQQTMTYRFSKAGLSAKPYVINFTAPFNEEGQIYGVFQLLSPDLALLLEDNAGPIEEAFDMFVDVEFSGVMSGSAAPISTGKATFPIKVFKSAGGPCTTPLANACRYLGQSSYQVFEPSFTCP